MPQTTAQLPRGEPTSIEISTLEELIMTALLNKELYGLQLVQAIEDASGGKRRIGAGSLYPTLHRLEKKKGLIESLWGDDKTEERGGARRRYYKLTGLGEVVLEETQQTRQNLLTWQPV